MRTSNGQYAYLDHRSGEVKILKSIDFMEEKFIGYLKLQGVGNLVQSLQLIHDIALYHSDYPINEAEKSALYDVKSLWKELERIGERI